MQEEKETYSLIWFRNDLRLRDNPSIARAIEREHKVLAVYCFDPRHFGRDKYGFRRTEKFRARFLLETVRELRDLLKALGVQLITEIGKPEDIIPDLCSKYPIDRIYYQYEWTSEERKVELNTLKRTPATVEFVGHSGQFLYDPEKVATLLHQIPDSFSSFRRKIEKNLRPRTILQYDLSKLKPAPVTNKNGYFPSLRDLNLEDFALDRRSAFPFRGGEIAAMERMDVYFDKTGNVSRYKETRNGLTGLDYSSKLSPWLANGSLSPAMVEYRIKMFESKYGANESTYWLFFELLWREFFKFVSRQYGNAIFHEGGIRKRPLAWEVNSNLITRWINGTTEDDFVNANMIELKKTGWMSNRGRQNVASYFCKVIRQDWRIGAAYFESMLLDYDVHSNYGNWMYLAGVGNDSRDRSFNTQSQADTYDPDGEFRRLWLEIEYA